MIDEYAIDEMEAKGVLKDNLPFCYHDYASIISYITYISSDALKEAYKLVIISFK